MTLLAAIAAHLKEWLPRIVRALLLLHGELQGLRTDIRELIDLQKESVYTQVTPELTPQLTIDISDMSKEDIVILFLRADPDRADKDKWSAGQLAKGVKEEFDVVVSRQYAHRIRDEYLQRLN